MSLTTELPEFVTDIDYNWHSRAACKGISTDLFFPGQGEPVDKTLIERCHNCPVQKQCLDHALHHEHYGYWGGTSEKQRVALRKELGITCNKPESIYTSETNKQARIREENRIKITGRGRKAQK